MADAESRRLLEKAVSPWLVTRWLEHDHGNAALVEITRATRDETGREATGKLFAVQIQATDAEERPRSLVITTKDLRYWLDYSLPVLLVSAHVKSQSLSARWIDEQLLHELRNHTPAFWAQENVTIPVKLEIVPATQVEIEAFVRRFRKRMLLIPPGRFFDLQRGVLTVAQELEVLGKECELDSVINCVGEMRKALRTSAYTVVIAGPQRAGKSTLVNALIGAEISPVADYPTTAVPLAFESGASATAHVYLADGSVRTVPATTEALRPFAAQQDNAAHREAVRLVRVTLPNDVLARGISLVDTPGLHDASATVRSVTTMALEQADAVLYVLDAALGPKFRLGQAEIEDLKSLQPRKDRLLIILNQADELDASGRQRLLAYVTDTLQRYGVWEGLPVKPIFVSGKMAWEARKMSRALPDEFHGLETHLWEHLLRQKATGLHRLEIAARLVQEACETATALLKARAVDGTEAGRLDAARMTCRNASVDVVRLAEDWQKALIQRIDTFLKSQRASSVATLRHELQLIEVGQDLPTPDSIRARLEGEFQADARGVWKTFEDGLEELSRRLGEVVGRALQDSRAELGIPVQVSLPLQSLALAPPDLSLPEAGLGLLGLLGFLVNPLFGVFSTLASFFFGHGIAVKRRHERVIRDLPKTYDKQLRNAFDQLSRDLQQRAAAAAQALVYQARGRLDTFIGDASRRVTRLGGAISAKQAERLRAIEQRFERAREAGNMLASEIIEILPTSPEASRAESLQSATHPASTDFSHAPTVAAFAIPSASRVAEATMGIGSTAEPGAAATISTTRSVRNILAVATEWQSRHGGLSTFNRDLCRALATAGHRVVCVVPEILTGEQDDAEAGRVDLVAPRAQPGIAGTEALLLDTPLPEGFQPDLVLGHDRKTGPHAAALARKLAGAHRVHFVHTRPEDIEWHKDKLGDDDTAIKAEERRLLQEKLAESAAMVVGVGPALFAAASSLVFLASPRPLVHRLDPGFHPVARPADLPLEIHCLVLGRAEDSGLKGLDIAARALGEVVRRGKVPSPPRMIVRGAPPGTGAELRRRLVEIAVKRLDIEVREYSPHVEQLQRDIILSSLVLMPSRSEGFGLVGLEAIAAGTPVLVSDRSGLAELLRERLGKDAEAMVVETHEALENAAPEWERHIEAALLDRPAAFARATALREKLSGTLTWADAVRNLDVAWRSLTRGP